VNYGYDIANRLTSVDSVTYTWDNNGNLLSDGVFTYTYNVANRLTSVTDGVDTYAYAYNASGDRLQQTVNAVLTNYTLDLAADLTQVLASYGTGSSGYAFTGEMYDPQTGLVFLRARYYAPGDGRFASKDVWRGTQIQPMSYNLWAYGYSNPLKFTDSSGNCPYQNGSADCSTGYWDWETVQNVKNFKQAFLDSAKRHNRIPGMDNNGFAGLLASIIVGERRIGNVPLIPDTRNRYIQWLENGVAQFGCTISGTYLQDALLEKKDLRLFISLFTNQTIPEGPSITTYASVGIGNMKLYTAENLINGLACSSFGNCESVQTSNMQTTNVFGFSESIRNPFEDREVCAFGSCTNLERPKIESYQYLAGQLLNAKKNIEYIAANLEAGALRAIALDTIPSAFNSATWHQMGVQTDLEIIDLERLGFSVGGAAQVLEKIPWALCALGLKSNWSLSNEKQYQRYKENALQP
jgi:RHS repeat-associated protein